VLLVYNMLRRHEQREALVAERNARHESFVQCAGCRAVFRLGAEIQAHALQCESHPMRPMLTALQAENAARQSDNAALSALALECATDLEDELSDRYQLPDVHPALQRKYDRDMAIVYQIRALTTSPRTES